MNIQIPPELASTLEADAIIAGFPNAQQFALHVLKTSTNALPEVAFSEEQSARVRQLLATNGGAYLVESMSDEDWELVRQWIKDPANLPRVPLEEAEMRSGVRGAFDNSSREPKNEMKNLRDWLNAYAERSQQTANRN